MPRPYASGGILENQNPFPAKCPVVSNRIGVLRAGHGRGGLPQTQSGRWLRQSREKKTIACGKGFRILPRMAPLPCFGNWFFLSSVLTAMLLAACQTKPENPADWDVPLTLKTFPSAYSTYAIEVADANRDGTITEVEWINAGGDKRSFLLVDANNDGVITRTELIRISSNAKFFDFVRRYADFNKDNQLTPREFRSAGGVRVLRYEF
jgi:hypothetical protein